MIVVTCADCGTVTDPTARLTVCPSCGSENRRVSASAAALLTAHGFSNITTWRPGERKPYREERAGDNLHRKTGTWNRLTRVIDREKDWYEELVTDREGTVIHHCAEPLSQHQGHGDARNRRKNRITHGQASNEP